MTLEEQIRLHEGIRLFPYRDTVGKLTIGVGRCIDACGITEEEALYLLRNDIARVTQEVTTALPWFARLSPIRQRVLVDMAFNLGTAGLLRFKMMLRAASEGEYEDAARAMRASRWAQQTKSRATRLAEMMRTDREVV